MRNEGLHKARTLAAKRLLDFIRSRPGGVTFADLKQNGLTTWGLDRLLQLGHVRAEQIREPERGTRAYHWLWKPSIRLPDGFGELPALPKLPPGLAEIFSKPSNPHETLPPEISMRRDSPAPERTP